SDRAAIEGDEVARYGVGRLLTLSDGVFAIALTVLVLSLHVDVSTGASELGAAIHQAWSEVYAYALSVVVIGGSWMGHHRLYAPVTLTDARPSLAERPLSRTRRLDPVPDRPARSMRGRVRPCRPLSRCDRPRRLGGCRDRAVLAAPRLHP